MDMFTILLCVIALLFLGLVVTLAALLISAPVSIPYLKASLSKDKYALLMVHNNGVISLTPAKFANSRAILSNGLAKFIKQGLKGSYSIGNIRCDLVHSEVAYMIEDQTLGVFDELKRAGIDNYRDLITRANQATLIRMGLLNQKEFTPNQIEEIKLSREFMLNNTKLITPIIRELNVQDMMQNCTLSPQRLAADTEETTALIAKQYRGLTQGKKYSEGSSGGLPINGKTIIIIAIVLIICGIGATFLMNQK